MRVLLAVLGTLAVLALLALVFPFTGLYDVAATAGHTGLGQWWFRTTSTRSIQARADASVPADLADPARLQRGAGNFDAMCRTCHGAPGAERGEIGEGLSPEPPRLSEAVAHWSPGEVYWILGHGIKNTGMPAFGPTHTEAQLWDLVAVTEALPRMTAEQYRAYVESSPGHLHGGDSHAEEAGGHTHADDHEL